MKQITVKNPWRDQKTNPTLSYTGKPGITHRGVVVYHNPAGVSWDWTFKGMAICQRVGKPDAATIDKVLDGVQPVQEMVAEHLRSHGFKAISYDEACER